MDSVTICSAWIKKITSNTDKYAAKTHAVLGNSQIYLMKGDTQLVSEENLHKCHCL